MRLARYSAWRKTLVCSPTRRSRPAERTSSRRPRRALPRPVRLLPTLLPLGLACGLGAAAQAADDERLPLAVAYFDNTSGDPTLDPLSRGLAEMLITDLSTSSLITVVERSRLNDVLGEIALQKNPYFDPSTAATLGKGLGAALIVTGSYLKSGGTLRIDARVIQVDDASVGLAVKVEGRVDDFLGLQRDLATRLLEGLGDRVSLVQRTRLARGGTRSYRAFLSYSNALAHLDEGDQEKAAAALQKAAAELARKGVGGRAARGGCRGLPLGAGGGGGPAPAPPAPPRDPDFRIAAEMKARVDELLRAFDLSRLRARIEQAETLLLGERCSCNHLGGAGPEGETRSQRMTRRIWPFPVAAGAMVGQTGAAGLWSQIGSFDALLELGLLTELRAWIEAARQADWVHVTVQARPARRMTQCITPGPLDAEHQAICREAAQAMVEGNDRGVAHMAGPTFFAWVDSSIMAGEKEDLARIRDLLRTHRIEGKHGMPPPDLLLPALDVLLSDAASPCLKAAGLPPEGLEGYLVTDRIGAPQHWRLIRPGRSAEQKCHPLEDLYQARNRQSSKEPPPLFGPSLKEQRRLQQEARDRWRRLRSRWKDLPRLPKPEHRWQGLDDHEQPHRLIEQYIERSSLEGRWPGTRTLERRCKKAYQARFDAVADPLLARVRERTQANAAPEAEAAALLEELDDSRRTWAGDASWLGIFLTRLRRLAKELASGIDRMEASAGDLAGTFEQGGERPPGSGESAPKLQAARYLATARKQIERSRQQVEEVQGLVADLSTPAGQEPPRDLGRRVYRVAGRLHSAARGLHGRRSGLGTLDDALGKRRKSLFSDWCKLTALEEGPAYQELFERVRIWHQAVGAFAPADRSEARERIVEQGIEAFGDNTFVRRELFRLRLAQGRIDEAERRLDELPPKLVERGGLRHALMRARKRHDGWLAVLEPGSGNVKLGKDQMAPYLEAWSLSRLAVIAYLELRFDEATRYQVELVRAKQGELYGNLELRSLGIDRPLRLALRQAIQDPDKARALKEAASMRQELAERVRARMRKTPLQEVCSRICREE